MVLHRAKFMVMLAMLTVSFTVALGIARGAAGAQDRPSTPQERGPSTPQERTRAVRVAHELEQDPLAKDAKEQRDWVIQWIVAIPDITVDVCFDYFGDLPHPSKGHFDEISKQMVISSAAFMIEHPDKAKDEQAVAMSGLLGALKAYEAVLRKETTARWPLLDKLVRMREQGKLDEYVSDTRRKCSQQEESDPDTMHAQARIPLAP
jgi:hypothetical protein